MIEFQFEEKTISLPTEWGEVTVETFVNPDFLSGDSIQLLSTLSGISREKLLNTTENLTPYFEKVSSFIKKDPQGWRGGDTPIDIEIEGVVCPIPADIELERFGQKVLMGQYIGKYSNPIEAIADCVAIYFAPYIYPEEWDEKIDSLSDKIKALPVTKIYPVADFFLSTILAYKASGTTS